MTIARREGIAWARLADVDPELWAAIRGRDRSPALEDRADRQRELHLRRGDGGAGFAPHQQVRRGPARQALLRRLRVRGRGRAARPGSRPGPLPRRRARQRPAPLRRAGQHGRLPRRCSSIGDRILGMNLAHGGHLTHGSPVNFSGKWFEVHPYGVDRQTEQIDYDALEKLGGRSQAEADRRRRQRLPAHHRLRADRPDRPRRRRAAHGGHGPHRRPRRRRPPPDAVRPRRHRHDHHAQDPARPARRPDLLPRRPGQGRGQERLPRHPGRPADARHRGQGRGPQARGHARVPRRPAPDDRQREGAGGHAHREGRARSSRAARTTT